MAATRRCLDLIGSLQHLNAVRCLDPTALEQAAARDAATPSGPLHGRPVLVKDNIDVAGLPTTGGSLALEHSKPERDAPLVTALRAAGAVIVGKTNLTELSNYMSVEMPSGYSSLGGQVLNPYDASRTPSGSSAGAAVAAALGLAVACVGTETSGSILSPAQACSVVGVKPTVGLVSRTGIIPISATQDTAGPLARTVSDAAALLAAMLCGDSEDPATGANPLSAADLLADGPGLDGARLGVIADDGELLAAACAVLREQGATLVDVEVAEVSAEDILTLELAREFDAYLARLPDGSPVRTLADVVAFNRAHEGACLKFGQSLLEEGLLVDLTDPETAAEYERVRDEGLAQARSAIDDVLADSDLDAIVSASATIEVGARAGYPTVSVPMGYTAHGREPRSITFQGTAWSEPRLLALAAGYERAAGVWRSPQELNPSLFRGP